MHLQSIASLLAIISTANTEHIERRGVTSGVVFPPISGAPTIPSACASVSATAAAQRATGTGDVYVPPSVALACLRSVPVDVANDAALIDYLLPYLSFQSTLGDLKSPPTGYLIPGVDVIGGFQAIQQKVRKGLYKSQYEFVADISDILTVAADGHLSYTPALLSVFSWKRGLRLTSISSDGVQLPKVYDYDDLLASSTQGYTAADITAIDGIDVVTYLVEASARGRMQDPDAGYNFLFKTIPGTASGLGNVFESKGLSMADNNTVTFSNETSKVYLNLAIVETNFDAIDTGDKLHQAVEIPPASATTTTTASNSGSTPTETPAGIHGYPSPVEIHSSKYASGYFLNDTGHQDTCVLVVYSFEAAVEAAIIADELFETRRVFRSFFEDCHTAGRNKLIIDVSANGGGLLFQGFDLYRTLFPNSTNWSGNTFRAHPALNFVGQVGYGTASGEQVLGVSLNPATSARYPTWADLFGPQVKSTGNETNVMVYDFANASTVSTGDPSRKFIVTGYDEDDPAPPQPFERDNVVVLTDGVCGSTCTVFVGLMAREAGVRTIVLGGRPMNAPMQAIGAVKGGQVQPFSVLQLTTKSLLELNLTVPPEVLAIFPSANPPPLMPTSFTASASVNWRNTYAQNATDGPALQFVYEAANCRRFYKSSYLIDITTAWADVADVAWAGEPCVPGSTVDKAGMISNQALGYYDGLVSKQQPYTGPGSLTNMDWQSLLTNATGTDSGPAGPRQPADKNNAVRTLSVNVVWVGLLALVVSSLH